MTSNDESSFPTTNDMSWDGGIASFSGGFTASDPHISFWHHPSSHSHSSSHSHAHAGDSRPPDHCVDLRITDILFRLYPAEDHDRSIFDFWRDHSPYKRPLVIPQNSGSLLLQAVGGDESIRWRVIPAPGEGGPFGSGRIPEILGSDHEGRAIMDTNAQGTFLIQISCFDPFWGESMPFEFTVILLAATVDRTMDGSTDAPLITTNSGGFYADGSDDVTLHSGNRSQAQGLADHPISFRAPVRICGGHSDQLAGTELASAGWFQVFSEFSGEVTYGSSLGVDHYADFTLVPPPRCLEAGHPDTTPTVFSTDSVCLGLGEFSPGRPCEVRSDGYPAFTFPGSERNKQGTKATFNVVYEAYLAYVSQHFPTAYSIIGKARWLASFNFVYDEASGKWVRDTSYQGNRGCSVALTTDGGFTILPGGAAAGSINVPTNLADRQTGFRETVRYS